MIKEDQELRGLRIIIANLEACKAEGWQMDEGASNQLEACLKRRAELEDGGKCSSPAGQGGRKERSEPMPQFENMVVELMVRYPELLSAKWFRELEMEVRAEITRWAGIMDSAGIV